MDGMLPVAEFNAGLLTPLSRYEAWRNLISAVFEPQLPDDHPRHDLTAEASSIHFGQVLLVNAKAEAQGFTRTRRLIAQEGLDHYLIQVYRKGVCNGTYGDVQNTVRPGDVKIIDLAQTFNTFNTDFDNATLTIPRAALPAELGLTRDARSLGVAVKQVAVWQAARLRLLDLETPEPLQGFHAFEPDCSIRWTDGDAVVPTALFDGFGDITRIEVRLGGGTFYVDPGHPTQARAKA